jgi:adenine-specific DNA-methyltransferase
MRNFKNHTVDSLIRELEKIESKRKYGLIWDVEKEPEKIVLDCQYKLPTLRNDKNKKIISDKQKKNHILIEGENYVALSVLNYTHKELVDVIYIDPPYNTGEDEFKYNDKYIHEDDGYRHSKWLSFMEKRLKLAKNLLKDDGIILIHIDEHELDRLYLLLTRNIFGEDNDLGRIIWDKRNPKGDSKGVSILHETILCFAKNRDLFLKKKNVFLRAKPNALKILNKAEKIYKNLGNKKIPEEIREAIKPYNFNKEMVEHFKVTYNLDLINKEFQNWMSRQSFSEGEKAYKYIDKEGNVFRPVSMAWPNKQKAPDDYFIPLIHPKTGKPCPIPKRGWRNPSETMKKLLKENLILFGENEHTQPMRIYLLKDNLYENVPSIYSYGGSDDDFFHDIGIEFPYAKPVEVAKYLIKSIHPNPKIVVDFFAGSGTALHAILSLNNENSEEIQCFLITNNENNVCSEVCYPRIKKVIKGYKDLKGKQIDGLGGNLQYYHTDFIDVDHIFRITDDQKIKITYEAGEMIAFKENTFYEQEKNEWWQIFSNEKKITAIYFQEDKAKLDDLIKKLTKMNKEIVLYIFSWGKNEYKNEFLEYENIRIEDIPEPIIEVYREINKL